MGSSSHGNCYLLQTPTGTLIIDAGVPFKEIQKALDFDLSRVRGCLVTHEHRDHSKAIKDVMKAGIDCYMGKGTIEALKISHHRAWIVQSSWPGYQFDLGDFTILPVEAQHDVPCLAFLIVYNPTGEKLLYATDTYYLKNRFQGLNFLLIECNYCKETLNANVEAGLIPLTLKNRLIESHFSLDNLKEFFKANDLKAVKKIVLIHLSDGNSNAAQMISEIHDLTKKDTVIAEAGKVIELEMCPF